MGEGTAMPDNNPDAVKRLTDDEVAEYGDTRLPTAFWSKVAVQANGCWQWTGAGANYGRGYGRFQSDGRKSWLAHRFAYEKLVDCIGGRFPDGLTVDHLCRNPGCVNPSHMELVSRGENTLRGNTVTAHNSRITHCPKGHPYTPENTLVVSGSDHRFRRCRECNRNNLREWHKKKREGLNAK